MQFQQYSTINSSTVPKDQSDLFDVAIVKKIMALPFGLRLKLLSTEISQKIQLLGQKYGFEMLRLANITRLIREYYFGEVRFENFPTEIEKRMGVSLLTAQEISRYIKQEIIDWDPWAEYIAKLPKMPIREIAQKYPKIANMKITAGYIELKGSEDLEDPSIKNWIKDYISHLGYAKHSQMDRTQYIFHSENGKNLSSQDREKLGIILKSFDENIPLPVDEENGEIVFDGVENKVGDAHVRPAPAPVSFIKPYAPISQPPTSPQPSPYQGEGVHPEINKYFSAHESPDIPAIKIHSITEHNEPKIAPQQIHTQPNIQRPTPPQPASAPRPQHRIIDPFFSKPMSEPRLDGNIVDLSGEE